MTLGPVVLDLLGPTLTAEEEELLLHPAVGGVILFARNIHSYSQLETLVASIRGIRPELLICVDQEGGRVQRCRDGFTRIPPMQQFDHLYQSEPEAALSLARECGWVLASEVLAIGMDCSFAPVLDVDDEFCSVIGDRAFSADPDRVSLLAEAFVKGAREAGMAVTGKHYPGHGSVRGDSHLELPVDHRSLEEIQAKDLKPFVALGDELDAVMPAHILFPQVDKDLAVGFSPVWLKGILRDQLGYKGVVFSDDLTMAGATQMGTYPERAESALRAGCDMVLVCNNREGAEAVLKALSTDLYFAGAGDRQSMRAHKTVSRAELEASPRWREAVTRLTALLPVASDMGRDPTSPGAVKA
ncbi:beta-N-acetylhexosaminidase [Aestuariicella hydrocarbonica]|uniref:Beta-hexosaminidase n=1 Tax=Pseudomaricurvus hydrocarbonicus TaxID=1470433 RepID=A0A9E5T4J5_9GAMM|nr:beta-N-acetylhexosaminidase [Aestuariicella hydrocarbonica]NHO68057.1 beta-N-acetylhexosaminidase [Aestuariicella hydrocarbonica]